MPYADLEKRKAFMRQYYRTNKEKWVGGTVRYRLKLKKQVFEAYGNRCACCGEDTFQFLSLDHVDNDGAAHKRALGTKCDGVYRWARDNGYPNSIQLLCMNCNFAKGIYGRCPHGNTQ